MKLAELRKAFWRAYDNPHSDFYRRFYASRGFSPAPDFPQSIEEWETLPLLRKENIAAVPLQQRIFVPKTHAISYRVSSGTSNRGVVIVPRTHFRDFSYWKPYTARVMLFHKSPHLHRIAARRAGLVTVDADAGDLMQSARLAALSEVDGFLGISPSLLSALIPFLERTYDLSRIHIIELSGERVSASKYELFRSKFPNALLHVDYASSESSSVGGVPCKKILHTHSMHVHPSEEAYFELIDTLDESGSGEVVLTLLLEDNAFPLLRYGTEDLARAVASSCSCEHRTYEILGRAAYDRVFVPGGLITSAELERALAPYHRHIEDDFQLHYYENEQPPRLELLVRARIGNNVDAENISRHVENVLRIAPKRVLAESVAAGLCTPVRCVLLREGAIQKGKELRIIVH